MMKIKSNLAMKYLRVFHIVTTAIWLGGVVCISVFTWICFFHFNKSDFLVLAPLVPELFLKVIMPASLLTILQGIVYGVFTNWGFFKHKWLILKWISIILLALLTGAGAIGQMFSVIEKTKIDGFIGGLADGGIVLLFMAFQIAILIFMVIISTIKPFRKKSTG